MILNRQGREVALTEDGFLVAAADWDEQVAEALARRAELSLTAEHWEIMHFIRGYYLRFQHLPNQRMFVKAVQQALGADKGNSRYLHRIFPQSPVRLACLLAGLPKPPGCL